MRIAVAGAEAYIYTGGRTFDAALPTVVFVHGAGHDHSVWALQSRYFAHHGRSVLAVDLPGHGRSDGDPLASIEAQAEWLAALLRTTGIQRAALVGHSMGALASLACSAQHPDLVSHLAMLGPAVPMPVSDELLDAARRNDPVAHDWIVAWSHAPASLVGGNPVPGMWMAGSATRLLQRAKAGVLACDLAACHRYDGGLAAAAAVPCPVLALTAERDLMASPRAAVALLDALPSVRSVLLPNCGHAMMSEAPDKVLDALRAFL